MIPPLKDRLLAAAAMHRRSRGEAVESPDPQTLYLEIPIAEFERLHAEIDRLRADIDMWHRHYAGLLNDAHDENARLRAQPGAGVEEMRTTQAKEIERLRAAHNVEHEIQRVMLERLGIEWVPGEPFVALIEDEITRLRIRLDQAHQHAFPKPGCPVCAEMERMKISDD